MSTTAEEYRIGSVLGVFSSQAINLSGSQIVTFMVVWHLTELTNSPTMFAIGSSVSLLPYVTVAPLVSPLVDRWDRKHVMAAVDLVLAVTTLLLALLLLLPVSLGLRLTAIFSIMFVRAAGTAIYWPTVKAVSTMLLPARHLSRISALHEALYGLPTIISPVVGAFLVEAMDLPWAVSATAVTALLSLIPLALTSIPTPPADEDAARTESGVFKDVKQSMQFVWRRPAIFIVMVVTALLSMLLIPIFGLQPLLITEHFGGGPQQLALLQSVSGIGMLSGGLLMGVWGGFRQRAVTAAFGVFWMGAASLAIGSSPAELFWVAVVGSTLLGASQPVTTGSLYAIVLATLAANKQGRIMILLFSGSVVLTPLGLLLAGPLAEVLGVRSVIAVSGAIAVLIGIAVLFVRPLQSLDE